MNAVDDHNAAKDELDRVDAYDYELPDELIAAHPAQSRAESRLLIAHREEARLEHTRFSSVVEHVDEKDLLVFNDTRVIPARVMGKKETGGVIELLFTDVVEPASTERWTTPAGGSLRLGGMTRSSNPPRPGMKITPDEDTAVSFEVVSWEEGRAVVEVAWEGSAVDLLERIGQMPLPPYILKRREALGEEEIATERDRRRYQTVYAQDPGAVAAPTAGLHFTEDLLAELDRRGVERAFVTLQVSAGTFRPVTEDRLSDHDMHAERYRVSPELGDAIERCRARGGRVVAVGTTSVRALESEARRDEPFAPGTRSTDLFLHPGVSFEVVDALVTNFHLPRSTLLALVSGFAGYAFTRRIYEEAVAREYRFYSYGDAMLIL
ncbi:MAG: tRNA preQ1(34) S-adenosylmethionine ribosyltransferase-isomerase QueA [Persicimonas sp.]